MMRRARITHDSLVTSGAPGFSGFDPKSPQTPQTISTEKRPCGLSAPASWASRPTSHASRPPGRGKGNKTKGKQTDVCCNFNRGPGTSPCSAGRAHACARCGRNGHAILNCFQCPEHGKQWFVERASPAKGGKKGKGGKTGKGNDLILSLLLTPRPQTCHPYTKIRRSCPGAIVR